MNVLAAGPVTDFLYWLRGPALDALLIVLGALLVARLVSWAGNRITDRIDAAATDSDALVRSEAAKHRHSLTQVLTWAAIVLIWSIAVIFALDRLGLPVTGLVAPATVLGVGLGFGAQRVVGDVLAGFFLITERQYGFGDVVSIQVVGGMEPASGTVEDVTLRITRVRSVDGEVVIVPNGQIVKVTNLSRDWARAVVDVPVPATADGCSGAACGRTLVGWSSGDVLMRPLRCVPGPRPAPRPGCSRRPARWWRGATRPPGTAPAPPGPGGRGPRRTACPAASGRRPAG